MTTKNSRGSSNREKNDEKNNTRRVSFTMPAAMFEWAEEDRKRKQMSISEYWRAALRKYLDK